MAPPDGGGLHITLTDVADIWSSDTMVGGLATAEEVGFNLKLDPRHVHKGPTIL